MSKSEIPSDDVDFLDQWKLDPKGPRVFVDIESARVVTKNRLRLEREPLMQKLDIAFIRTLETGASTAEIVAEKQRLRDITLLTDACTTTAELRALNCAST